MIGFVLFVLVEVVVVVLEVAVVSSKEYVKVICLIQTRLLCVKYTKH